jgi:hypothetical protein
LQDDFSVLQMVLSGSQLGAGFGRYRTFQPNFAHSSLFMEVTFQSRENYFYLDKENCVLENGILIAVTSFAMFAFLLSVFCLFPFAHNTNLTVNTSGNTGVSGAIQLEAKHLLVTRTKSAFH